jgi:predicted SAM-dependent methyltransferase
VIKLDIGAGKFPIGRDFLSVDAYTNANIKAFMWELPFRNNSVDFIYCSQALEHIPKERVLPTFKEWYRVLKPEGLLQFAVPDLEWACTWWLLNQTTGWSMDILFGNQKHEGEFHRTGFTTKIVWDYLNACGGWYVYDMTAMGGEVSKTPVGEDQFLVKVSQVIINVQAQKTSPNFVPQNPEFIPYIIPLGE